MPSLSEIKSLPSGLITSFSLTRPIFLFRDSSTLRQRNVIICLLASGTSGSYRVNLLFTTFQKVFPIANCSPTCMALSAAICSEATVWFISSTLSPLFCDVRRYLSSGIFDGSMTNFTSSPSATSTTSETLSSIPKPSTVIELLSDFFVNSTKPMRGLY